MGWSGDAGEPSRAQERQSAVGGPAGKYNGIGTMQRYSLLHR